MSTKTKPVDMLHGSLWNKILLFALPVAATAVLEQLFNASDIAVVGSFAEIKRTESVAAIGAISPVIGLILNLFIGISLGSNVIIATSLGKGDKATATKAVHTSVVTAFLAGILVAVIGELSIAQILKIMMIPEDVYPLTLLYMRIYFSGLPMILLYNFEAAIFRSIGKTNIPLFALAGSGILNIILNLFFVIKLHMSVNGVAIATVLSNTVSAALLFYLLCNTDMDIKISLGNLKIDFSVLKNILKIGLPAGIQSAVFAFANIVIQSAINSLGTVIMAASSAAYNIEIIAYYVMNSFSQACTTFTGHNYGAGNLKRCKKTLILCLVEGIGALAISVIIILTFGKTLISLFNNDPDVITIGYMRLIIIMAGYTFSLIYEILSGYLRGFGISLIPAILTIIGVCGVRIGWIHFIFPYHKTFSMIMAVYPLSLSTTAILILLAVIHYHPSKYLNKNSN